MTDQECIARLEYDQLAMPEGFWLYDSEGGRRILCWRIRIPFDISQNLNAGRTRRVRMPVNYTNRKGQTYTLYQGQTRTGKPRYYFGRAGQGQGEPVTETPAGYTISESINGVVSLVKDKDRRSLIHPEGGA